MKHSNMHVIRVPECKGRREDKKKVLKNSQTISNFMRKMYFRLKRVLWTQKSTNKKSSTSDHQWFLKKYIKSCQHGKRTHYMRKNKNSTYNRLLNRKYANWETTEHAKGGGKKVHIWNSRSSTSIFQKWR